MSDNTTLNAGSGGDVIATDEISGAKYQRVKLIHGADGVNAGDVAAANPLPVLPGHLSTVSLELEITGVLTNQAVVAVSAGTRIVVTEARVSTDNANTADFGFRLGFGAATTPTTSGVVLSHPGLPSGLDYGRGNGAGIIGVGADGEDLRITAEDPSGAARLVVSYYTISA